MQTEKFLGLTADYSENVRNNWYTLKESLTQCRNILEHTLRNHPDKSIVLMARLNKEQALTVYGHDKTIMAGVYEKNNNRIQMHLSEQMLEYIDRNITDMLEFRAENMERSLNMGKEPPALTMNYVKTWENNIHQMKREADINAFDNLLKSAMESAGSGQMDLSQDKEREDNFEI